MTKEKYIKGRIPKKAENPFSVPEDYFKNLTGNIESRIGDLPGEEKALKTSTRISLRPYLSLAAIISGVALISVLLIQTVINTRGEGNLQYDLALLEETGFIHDESILEDSYNSIILEDNTVWEDEAMEYLATNDVDLEILLASY